MADYSTIHGFTVQTLAADPPAPGEGQVWFNSTSQVLKGYGQQGTGAWASGGTMNPPHVSSGGYCGTQDAGVYAGGIPGDITTTQTYNGTAWSASPATLNVGRHYMASTGVGVQTAAMLFGGELPAPPHDSNSSEEFDGSTWTATPAINTARGAIAGAGTATAAIGATGNLDGGGASNKTENWNGSTWTEVNTHNNSIKYVMGGGTQTSAFTAGGAPAPMEATSSQWDGTSWSADATLNTGRNDGSRGAGSGTAALIFSGNDAPSRGAVESFNGTTWTTEASLATARQAAAGSGTSMSSIAAGGAAPALAGLTEEWSVPSTTKTFTAS